MAIRAPDGANKFRFSFSIPLQNERKKGQGIMSNISPKKMVHRYLHNTIFNFKLKFHLEDGLVEQCYFELFLSMVYIFIKEAVFDLFLHLL